MAVTNFGKLLDHQRKVWCRDVWKVARENSFIMQFAGTSPNSIIHRITELSRTNAGDKAIITLVPDLEGDGVVGDNQLDGNEEAMSAFDREIVIDQLRHATTNKGRMADQKVAIKFREQSKDKLGYWLADRIDQLAFLTLSGLTYDYRLDGRTRDANSQLKDLAFASYVTAPSANRYYRWDKNSGLLKNDPNTNLLAEDTPTYQMLVEMKAQARVNYMRPVRTGVGGEVYHVFMNPLGIAKLKLEADFKAALLNAGVRGNSNPLFTGALVTVDGLVIHDYRHVFCNINAGANNQWGATGNVAGQRVIMAGAQALAFGDLGDPGWEEEGKDYSNRQGIAIDKMLGFLKPKFPSAANLGANEDFGVMVVDTAI